MPIVRKTPTPENFGPVIDEAVHARAVNDEVTGLWERVACLLTGVGGTANAITASADAALTVLTAPMTFYFLATATSTASITLNINGTGAKEVRDLAGNPLLGGEIVAGRLIGVVYLGTNFRLLPGGAGSQQGAGAAPDFIVRDEKASGVEGGTFTSGAFRTRTLNSVYHNALPGASLDAVLSRFSLQAGTYYIAWQAPSFFVNRNTSRLFNVTDGVAVADSRTSYTANSDTQETSHGVAVISIVTAKQFEIQHQSLVTRATNGFGVAGTYGALEIYTVVEVYRVGGVDSQVAGRHGGAITIPYIFSTTTVDADPGDGKLRLNSATQNTATQAYLDLLAYDLTDWTTVLDSLDVTQARLVRVNDPTRWIVVSITGRTTATGYRKFSLAVVGASSATPFADGDQVLFTASAPPVPAGTAYRWSTTTTDLDPGDGFLRANNATPASATQLFIDLNDADGGAQASWIDGFNNSTSAVKGELFIRNRFAPTIWLRYDVTGVVTVAGYRKLAVQNGQASVVMPDGAAVALYWTRSGDRGDAGSTGGTISADFNLPGDITPTQIAADQNNYNPTGASAAAVIRVDFATDGLLITGFAGGADGRVVIFRNIGVAMGIFSDENANSTAANRFALSGGLHLTPGETAALQYDATLSRWTLVAESLGGWRRRRLAADVVNNNAVANTLQNVTGLAFPVEANKRYAFYVYIGYTAAAITTGSRWTINGPAAASPYYRSTYTLTATTETLNYLSAFQAPAASNVSALTAGNTAVIEGVVSVGANAGTVQIQFASEIASSAITALANFSYIEWVELF